MSEQLPATSAATASAKNLALVVYILQAAGIITALTPLVGLIVNYVKRDDVRGTFVASHFDWQIKTFWYTLLGMIVSILLLIVGIGILLMTAVAIWYIYRIVKGWLALTDGKELPSTLI